LDWPSQVRGAAKSSSRAPNRIEYPSLIVAAALALVASPVIASPLSLGLEAGSTYYEHRAAPTAPLQFQGHSLEPILRYNRWSDRTRLWFEARRRFDLYSGAPIASGPGGTIQTADHFDMVAGRTWTEQNRLDVSGSYVRSRDVLDIDQPIPYLQSQVTEWGGSVGASIQRFEASYSGRGWHYQDPLLQDAMSHGWTLRFLPIQRATSDVFINWRGRDLVSGSLTTVESDVAAAGVRHSLGAWLSAEAEAGMSGVTYAGADRQTGAEAGVGLKTEAGGPYDVSMRWQVERVFPPTLMARVSRGVGDGRIWLDGESLVDVEGGYYRDPTYTHRMGLGVQDTLARATLVGFETSYVDLRPLTGHAAPAQLVRTSGWLARRLRPWLTARVGCAYFEQTGGGTVGVPSFNTLRLNAAITTLTQ
jgi:hypothetical protein